MRDKERIENAETGNGAALIASGNSGYRGSGKAGEAAAGGFRAYLPLASSDVLTTIASALRFRRLCLTRPSNVEHSKCRVLCLNLWRLCPGRSQERAD